MEAFKIVVLLPVLLSLPTVMEATSTAECKTVSGPSSGVECVFPFILFGIKHEACTYHGASDPDKPECVTKVDGDGVYIEGNWGVCGPECQVEEGCSTDLFQCKDGRCINKDYKCDGGKDCQDGSDETEELCGDNCGGFNFLWY